VELVQALVKVMNQRNLREYRELIARKDGRGETWLAYGNLKYETPGADSTQSSKTPLAIGCIARTFYPTNPGHADGVRRLLARQLEVDPSAPGVARLKSALEVTGLLVETCGHLAAGKPLKEDIIAWLGRIVQIIALPGTGRILVDIDTVSAGQADKLMQPIIKSTKDPAVKESASRYNAAWKDYEKQYPPL
jgi:hypothetical protein